MHWSCRRSVVSVREVRGLTRWHLFRELSLLTDQTICARRTGKKEVRTQIVWAAQCRKALRRACNLRNEPKNNLLGALLRFFVQKRREELEEVFNCFKSNLNRRSTKTQFHQRFLIVLSPVWLGGQPRLIFTSFQWKAINMEKCCDFLSIFSILSTPVASRNNSVLRGIDFFPGARGSLPTAQLFQEAKQFHSGGCKAD